MPQEQEQFQKNVSTVLEAVMFENWIRFYFIKESGEKDEKGEDKLTISIPQKGMDKIKELYPQLLSLAEDVNGREASFETSRNAVCGYVLRELDGKTMQQGTSASIFDTRAFQTGTQLFNIWVQAYEEKLDQEFLEFGMWRRIFNDWRASEQGRELTAKIEMAAPSGQKAAD